MGQEEKATRLGSIANYVMDNFRNIYMKFLIMFVAILKIVKKLLKFNFSLRISKALLQKCFVKIKVTKKKPNPPH